MKRSVLPAALAVLVLLAVLRAVTPAALAADVFCSRADLCGDETGSYDQKNDFWHSGFKRYDLFFDRLVAEGTISAEQEAAIKSAIENAVKDARQQGNWNINMSTILAGLVGEGKLTPEQKTAVENALRTARLENVIRRVKRVLAPLVAAGTLSAVQEEKILSAVADVVSTGARPDMGALLGSLVRSGVITAEQQKAVEKALMAPSHGRLNRLKGHRAA